MPRILHKIKDSTEDLSKINNNFDNIALDIADRSGAFSSLATVSGIVVASGSSYTIEVSVQDSANRYQLNKCPIIPRILTFVDTDNDGSYIWPLGSSLTAANIHGIDITTTISRTVIDEITDEKATYIIKIKNADASSHTFYVYTDVYYVPAPEQGIVYRA